MKILSDDSIGALMDSRTSVMNKTISIFIVCSFVFGFNVVAMDNLIENGTFDDDLEGWDLVSSPQFSIEVVNKQAQINGNGVSLWWDINSNLNNGMSYNLNSIETPEMIIDGQTINSYLTLESEVEELIINPNFDDDSEWYYREFGNIDYINGIVNNTTNTFNVNSTNMLVEHDDLYAKGVINQTTITLTKDGFLNAKVSYKHDFINTSGAINSNMKVKINSISHTIYEQDTFNNVSWTNGNISELYVLSGDTIKTTLGTNHTLVEGDYNHSAKITTWDNCYVNITSYETNGTYIGDVLNVSQNCSWGQLITYTNFNPISLDEQHMIYFRNGDTESPDGTWSSWVNIGDPDDTSLENGIYKNIYSVFGYNQYSQYKIEWEDNLESTVPSELYGIAISGVTTENNVGSSSLTQIVSKPYTNYTILEYDQQVLIEDILGGNITVSFGDYIVGSYNISDYNESINSFSFMLPESIKPMGDYELNFTVETIFALPDVSDVRIPMDVVFALDNSGSMTETDMNNLKTATKNLIGMMNETDRVAIFTYDGDGNEDVRPFLHEPFAYMTSANKTLLNLSVDSIVDGGYTCFYDTVGEAINYTQNNMINGRLEYVIAMTDGESNSDDDWSPEDVWGNITTNDPNDYDSDDLNQSTKGLKGILEAPCIVYTIGLGITHDSNYPSAPNWSYTPPAPDTGIEYDVWNVATSSPDLLNGDGGKYGVNETGVDNTGKYFFTDDSSDLPAIFESLYGSIYVSEVSGINCSCVVNFDNVRVLITPQAPVITTFYVRDSTPVSFDFYGTFTDYTLNKEYDFDTEGIESINIIVADTYNLTVTDITHLGSGVYEFEYVWSYPPVALNDTVLMDTYAVVIDNTGNVGIDYVSIARPTVLSVLIYIGVIFLFAFIILTICRLIKKAFVMEKLIE